MWTKGIHPQLIAMQVVPSPSCLPPPRPRRSLVAPAASHGRLEHSWYLPTETLLSYFRQKATDLCILRFSLWFYLLVAPQKELSKSAHTVPQSPVPLPPGPCLQSPPFPATKGFPRREGRNLRGQSPGMSHPQPRVPSPAGSSTVLPHAEATGCPGQKQRKNLGS